MRIVSSFHDYYDRALAHGHDDRLVYVRETRRVVSSDKEFEDYAGLAAQLPGGTHRTSESRELRIEPFWLALGGKLYPGLALRLEGKGGGAVTRMSYGAEDFEAFLDTNGFSLSDARSSWLRTPLSSYSKFFMRTPPDISHLLVRKRASLVLVWDTQVVLNPNLKQLEFFRCKGPSEVFQELEMFLGGVVAPENNAMVAIEDKYRIAQHGFDRYSFRRAPRKSR